MKRLRFTIAALAGVWCLAQPAMADEQVSDSNSAAAHGFVAAAQNAKGVILRVPVNARGEENTSAASLRVYSGNTNTPTSFSEAEAVWNVSKDQNSVPQVTDQSIQDGATWGWNRYNYGYGWRGGYNYYNYNPYSYYYGNYYTNYSNYYPNYYTNYYNNYGYGYRYYNWYY